MPDQEETVPFIPYEIQAIPSDFPIPSYWWRNGTPINRPGSYIKITGRQEGGARLRYQTHSLTVGVQNQEGINPSTLQDAYTNVQFPCAGWGIHSVPVVEPTPQGIPVPANGIITMDVLERAYASHKVLKHVEAEDGRTFLTAKCLCGPGCHWVEQFECDEIIRYKNEWTVNGNPLVLLKEKRLTGFAKFMKDTA